LAHLNATNFAVTIAGHGKLLLNDNNTRICKTRRIRATDQQKATMKIGVADSHRHRFIPDGSG